MRPCFLKTRPNFWFSFKASKARPSVQKARRSIWKAQSCVLRQVLDRVFRFREFMKIWSVKRTSLVESSMINLFNLYFINNTFSYSLGYWVSYIPIYCISYLWHILQSWFNNQYLKKKNSQRKEQIYTVADWDSMGRVITQTRARAFQTLAQAFRTLGQAFGFLLNPQKLGQVFQKLSWVFQRLHHMVWKKCLAESFDERTH